MQVFGYTLQQAAAELALIRKETGGYVELCPSPVLPAWAATPSRTSDGYLVQLAALHGFKLATLDQGIKDPAAVQIP